MTAERAGLNPRHLQKLEAAELNVTLDTICRLCEAFGVEIGRLVGDGPAGERRAAR